MSGGGEKKLFAAVTVTSNVNAFQTERRFQVESTVAELKGKLEMLTGVAMNSMRIELQDAESAFLATLSDGSMTLEQLGVRDGMKLHVIDTGNREEEEEEVDVAFKLPDEEYERRDDSMRKFLEKNKLGRFDEEKAQRKAEEETRESKLAESIAVGQRCEVRTPGQPVRRGEVCFVGSVHFKDGAWVGVKLDEPMGKNDGSVDGRQYFQCKAKYGSFVRPSNVTVGDFPELDEFEEI